MAKFTDFFDKKGFSKFYAAMNADNSTYESVYAVLADRKMTDRKRAEVAESIITQVCAYEYAKQEALSGESKQIFDNFMAGVDTLDPEVKTRVLLELDFGLDLYQNSEMAERIKDGAEITTLFKEHYSGIFESGKPDDEQIKDSVYNKLANFRFSPEIMQMFTENLKNSQVCVTCAAISEKSERFKAELAARIFASDENMTVEQAVYTACTLSDSQMIADAAGEGIISREKIKEIIAYIAVIAMIVSVVALCVYFGAGFLAMTLESAAIGAVAGFGFVAMTIATVILGIAQTILDNDLITGSFAAKRHFVKHVKETKLIEGAQALGEYDSIAEEADTDTAYEYEVEKVKAVDTDTCTDDDCDYDYFMPDDGNRVKA